LTGGDQAKRKVTETAKGPGGLVLDRGLQGYGPAQTVGGTQGSRGNGGFTFGSIGETEREVSTRMYHQKKKKWG